MGFMRTFAQALASFLMGAGIWAIYQVPFIYGIVNPPFSYLLSLAADSLHLSSTNSALFLQGDNVAGVATTIVALTIFGFATRRHGSSAQAAT